MPRPLLIFGQSDYLLQVVNTNSNTEWQTVQIQISWLLQKPTDLDLHCLQRQGMSWFSRTRVKNIFFLSYWEKKKQKKHEFGLTTVCAPSVFESVKFYCIYLKTCHHIAKGGEGGGACGGGVRGGGGGGGNLYRQEVASLVFKPFRYCGMGW